MQDDLTPSLPMVLCGCGCSGLRPAKDKKYRLRYFLPGHHKFDQQAGFWAQVQIGSPDECWPWIGQRYPYGYGRYGGKNQPRTAHRAAWTFAFGPIPDGLNVLHHCDNPPCANPFHLWLGTTQDNVDDKMRKGRGPTGDRNGTRTHPESILRGERQGCAKLTDEAVREIRRLHAAGELNQSELARKYGVTSTAVRFVVIGRNWGHVV